MTTELTKAAQQALEQLEFLNACYPHKTAADAIAALQSALTQRPAAQAVQVPALARSMSEWHEEDGTVMWWAWNGNERGWAGEAAYIGSPLCDDWPGYHTHWTPHPSQPVLTAAHQATKEKP